MELAADSPGSNKPNPSSFKLRFKTATRGKQQEQHGAGLVVGSVRSGREDEALRHFIWDSNRHEHPQGVEGKDRWE